MRMKSFKNDSGATAMVFALALIPLLMGGGLAIDYMRMANFQRELQHAADTAALAGAAFSTAPTEALRRIAATNAFNANKPTDITVSAPVVTFLSGNRIRVNATSNIALSFMRINWGAAATTKGVSAGATAKWPEAPVCIHTLKDVNTLIASKSFALNSNAVINAPGCHVQVNSNFAPDGLYINSSSQLLAASVCLPGNGDINSGGSMITTVGGNYTNANETMIPDCAAKPDPLSSLTPPAVASEACQNTSNLDITSSMTLPPGRYCHRIVIRGPPSHPTIVTLVPGAEYAFGGDACVPHLSHSPQCSTTPVVNGGELNIDVGGKMIGTDNLIYMTGNNTSRLNVNPNGALNIRGRSTGIHKGIAIMQKNVGGLKNDGVNWTAESIFNSNADSKIEGVVYLPETKLQYNSNSGAALTNWMLIVAQDLEVNSGGASGTNTLDIGSNFSAPGAVPLPDLFNSYYRIVLID